MDMKVIAHIYTDFPEKFGIPRQSGLIPELTGKIVFEPEYRNVEAVRGLDGFDYIWLIWQFQGTEREHWSATVKPPRLGGKKKMGVFATRAPFRPNPIGLSSVKLTEIQYTEEGPVLLVSGIDLKSGTPIFDIKPYLPYVDAHPEARDGFAEAVKEYRLQVEFPEEILGKIPKEKQSALIQVLEQDPRPSVQRQQQKEYGVSFAGYNVRFTVEGDVLQVVSVECDR